MLEAAFGVPFLGMRTKVCLVSTLSLDVRVAMWRLVQESYDGATESRFVEDLFDKSHVILLRSEDGDLQGFSTLQVTDHECGGRKYRAIFSGDTVLREKFWGNGHLARAFGAYILKVRLKTLLTSPRTIVYWFLLSKGFKTYLIMANNFSQYFPRPDRPTPSEVDQIRLHYYSQKYLQTKCHFDEASGILIPEPSRRMRLKHGVAGPPAGDKQNMKTDYFVHANPNWSQGEELACIARVSVWVPLVYSFKFIFKSTRWQISRARKQNDPVFRPLETS
jgi:hypothetical protein